MNQGVGRSHKRTGKKVAKRFAPFKGGEKKTKKKKSLKKKFKKHKKAKTYKKKKIRTLKD